MSDPEAARARAARLVRANLIGAGVLLTLAGTCYGTAFLPRSNPTPSDEGTLGIFVAVFFLLPYALLVLLAAGSLRLWPRAGLAAHVIAWSWPILAIAAFFIFDVAG